MEKKNRNMRRTGLMMAPFLVLLFAFIGMSADGSTALATETVFVDYIDESGAKQTCADARVLESGANVECDGGWYVVKDSISFTSPDKSYPALRFKGNTHLILADGGKISILSNECIFLKRRKCHSLYKT